MLNHDIRWGILGLGKIAHKFAEDLSIVEGGHAAAVASRALSKAQSFAGQYQIPKAYGSYEDLLQDPSIDAVYIATPHVFHQPWTIAALDQKKAVLCEKPLGLSAAEVQAMIRSAEDNQCFLMEALWTRFLPATEKVLQIIKDGAIGAIQSIEADFGYAAAFDPQSRLFNPALGGGSLLDIGIYPLYLCELLLGPPTSLQAMARFSPTGVDSYCAMLLDYGHAAKARLLSTLDATTRTEASIYGSKGSVYLHPRFHESQRVTLHNEAGETHFNTPYTGQGFVHEIAEVHQCLQEGRIASEKHSHQDSLALAELLDRVREAIGLVYE